MRKDPNARWIRLHTIAFCEKGPWYSAEGLIAVVEGNEAGVVAFSHDSYFGMEEGVELTQRPLPEQVFDIPGMPYVNPWDYISIEDYVNHPKVAEFSPEISWLWEGTVEELFYAAKNNTDLMFPTRKLVEEDVDYKSMMALYANIRTYLSKKNRKKKSKHDKVDGGFSAVFQDDIEE